MNNPANSPGEFSLARPYGLYWRSHTLFIISTVIIGLFSETCLYGIVVPVLPFILQDRIGVPQESRQGYSSALLAANTGCSVIFSPIAGAIADRSRARRVPFIIGLLILIASTITFFAGRSVLVLVIARCVQGASAAFIWTVGFALCFDTVGSENMGKTIGTIMAFVDMGTLFSPPLGGLIYRHAGVIGVATVAIGILVLDLIMRILLIEKKVAGRYTDWSSSAPVNEHSTEIANDEQGESSPTEESPLLKGKDVLPLHNRILHAAPILICLGNSSMVAALLVCVVYSILIGAFEATIPLEANELFGFGSLQAGLLLIPVGCLKLVASPIGGWAVDRYGPKIVSVIGFTFLTPVLVFFRLLEPEPRATQIALYCVLLALSGLGMATVGIPGFVETGEVVKRYHEQNPGLFGEKSPIASVYGIYLMVFYIGITLGSVLAGSLRESINYGNMSAVLGGLTGISAIVSFIWLGGKPEVLKSTGKK